MPVWGVSGCLWQTTGILGRVWHRRRTVCWAACLRHHLDDPQQTESKTEMRLPNKTGAPRGPRGAAEIEEQDSLDPPGQ